ncbi:hypothetical protein N7528_008314 [Penicillium herquei]|nr:hypothetical protein N7528_008314 [Penicillium herquei]
MPSSAVERTLALQASVKSALKQPTPSKERLASGMLDKWDHYGSKWPSVARMVRQDDRDLQKS